MEAWLLEPVYWNWWVLGVALMAVLNAARAGKVDN